ncbi:O-antigen ligase family protein [Rhizobium cauense]|uniref:O-antigen ligase family protein n=1 Tax=Rhizobium cauense TaxID=1166683 RepID=UPI001C6E8969|nr:O-antigen ligase family protein [Rhizobium cauense]MBW9113738.1 O-antigen ligase family protein [Rhizobium cauense]
MIAISHRGSHKEQPVLRSSAADPGVRLNVNGRTRIHGLASEHTRLAWPVKVFLLGLIIPWVFPIGTVNLSLYRIVLLALLVPCLFMWLRGKAGKKKPADFGLLLFCAWAAIAFIAVEGVDQAIEPAGILFIETMGSYLLARVYIRNVQDFQNMVIFVAKLIVCVLPFALYEWVTGKNLLLLAFGSIFRTEAITTMAPRMGFWRVQGPFSHSILFGTFCGSMVALTCLATKGRLSNPSRRSLTFLVGFAALLSMSSAPIGGVFFQISLLLWNWILGGFAGRWKLIWTIALLGYLVVELGSNQTPAQFYISHFTFEQQTGWYRLSIWEYGSASVASHPFFGIGLGDWARPAWMGDSVDNFWLLMAMRHGLPGLLLIVLSMLSICFAIAKTKGSSPQVDDCRTSYLICMVAFAFVGSTVHFWVAAYAWFFFIVGSGVWILDSKLSRHAEGNRLLGMGRYAQGGGRAETPYQTAR